MGTVLEDFERNGNSCPCVAQFRELKWISPFSSSTTFAFVNQTRIQIQS